MSATEKRFPLDGPYTEARAIDAAFALRKALSAAQSHLSPLWLQEDSK